MKLKLALAALAVASAGSAAPADARSKAPLHNPAIINIGFVCQWNLKCMNRQEQAMRRALKHVEKYDPPTWKIQLCNRNASRTRTRVDWIGYNNCIRNAALKRPAPPTRKKRRR